MPNPLRAALAAIRGHAGHSDPRAALANTVALVVASNQPFYPLYLYWAVSPTIWPALVSFLSTPLFVSVPALARRSTLAARSVLMLAGLANTLLCRVVLGSRSGVEAFLFPCLILAFVLFRKSERGVALAFAAAAFLIYLMPDTCLPSPAHLYTDREYFAFQRLNFISAASLTALIALLCAGQMEQEPRMR